MGAVWMRARAELRARWRAWVAMGLLVGIAGGAAIAAAAGARRTESAYPRFLREQRAMDVLSDIRKRDPNADPRGSGYASGHVIPAAELRALPMIETASPVVAMFSIKFERARGSSIGFPDVYPIAATDGTFGIDVNRPKVLEGRAVDPSSVDEVTVGFAIAEQHKIRLGDRLEALIYAPFGDADAFRERLSRRTMRVVGISAMPAEFQPLAGASIPTITFSTVFWKQVGEKIFKDAEVVYAIRFRNGDRDLPAFDRALESRGYEAATFFKQSTQTATVRRSMRFIAASLWMLAGLTTLAVVVVLGQAIARQGFLESEEHPTLRALGMTRAQLIGVGLVRATVIAATAVVIAVSGAYLTSSVTLTGLARIAEPDLGLRFDVLTLGAGAAGIVVLIAAVSSLAHWRAARAAASVTPLLTTPSRTAALLGRVGAAPTLVAGARLAFEAGKGRTSVPVRSSLAGATLGIVALVSALTFSNSLDHLTDTPSLTGWTFDIATGGEPKVMASIKADLEKRGLIDLWVEGGAIPSLELNDGDETLDGVLAFPAGAVGPAIAEGRAPRSADEVALGRETMEKLRVGIGDSLKVAILPEGADQPLAARTMRVVGRNISPSLGFNLGSVGEGASLTADGFVALGGTIGEGESIFIRLRRGIDPRPIGIELRDKYGLFVINRRGTVASDDASRVSSTPLIYAGIVLLMALATLVHTLVSAIRRRGRDLAILKTLGFVKRQVRATVAWQASALVLAGLAVGVPIGIACGRYGWNAFADTLGVVPAVAVPVLTVALAVPALIAIGNVVAAIPARAAARTQPALVLRAE